MAEDLRLRLPISVCMELAKDCKAMIKVLSAVERLGVVEEVWAGERRREEILSSWSEELEQDLIYWFFWACEKIQRGDQLAQLSFPQGAVNILQDRS